MGGQRVDRLQTSGLGHPPMCQWVPPYKNRGGLVGIEEGVQGLHPYCCSEPLQCEGWASFFSFSLTDRLPAGGVRAGGSGEEWDVFICSTSRDWEPTDWVS